MKKSLMNVNLGLGLSAVRNIADVKPSGIGGGGEPETDYDIVSWSQIGATYTASNAYATVAPLDGDNIALLNRSSATLQTLQQNAGGLSAIGNVAAIAGASNFDGLAQLNSDKVLFLDIDSNNLHAYQFDGTDWTLISSLLGAYMLSGYASGCYAQEADTAFIWPGNGGGSEKIHKIKYSGGALSEVGTGLDVPSANYITVVATAPDRVAILNTVADTIEMWDFASGTKIGNTYNLPEALAGSLGMTWLGGDTIAYWRGANIQALSFDGTDWSLQGSAALAGASSWPRSLAVIQSTIGTSAPRLVGHYYGSSGNVKLFEASTVVV